MAVPMCTPQCPHLRALRFGSDGVTRIVGGKHEPRGKHRDKFATCAFRLEATILVASLPGCIAPREREAAKGKPMAMHFARIEESERLQRVHRLLSDGAWHGTREIMLSADVCAVNSIITELRHNGYDIRTRCVGRGRYEYRLQIKAQGELF